MGRGLLALIVAGVALIGLYVSLMLPASGGRGYPGPGVRASLWYFGGPSIFRERPSARTGSPGGPGYTGGGLRGGK